MSTEARHIVLTPAPAPRGRDALRADVVAVAERARRLETRAFEEAEPARILTELVPQSRAVVEDALALLADVVAQYEAQAEPGHVPELTPAPDADSNFYRDIENLVAEASSATRICDLALVARIELKGKKQQLAAIGAEDAPWSIISACASARRKVLKGAVAIDVALADHEKLPRLLDGFFATELQRALEVRKAYTKLRRRVAVRPPPEAATIQPALRGCGVALAVVVGSNVYEDLRVDDRIQLRQFQRQIIAWLQLGEAAPPRAGLKLWQDLFAFTGVLVDVNNRAALREHDREEILAAIPEVRAAGPAPLPAELRRKLHRIFGRDDQLDELLARPEPAPASDVLSLLEGLATALGGAAEPTSPALDAPVPGDTPA